MTSRRQPSPPSPPRQPSPPSPPRQPPPPSPPQIVRRRTGRVRALRLRCTCGSNLPDINAAGENTIIARRTCSCGITWNVELGLTGFERDLPRYRIDKISRSATP